MFQVKKSSHSKKVAKKLRERARKERQREEVAQLGKEFTAKNTMDTKATAAGTFNSIVAFNYCANNSDLHVEYTVLLLDLNDVCALLECKCTCTFTDLKMSELQVLF